MAHRVRLRRAAFEDHAKQLELDSQIKQAQAIGVHGSTHSRNLAGVREPSGLYMFGVLSLFPAAGVQDLFELVREGEHAGESA